MSKKLYGLVSTLVTCAVSASTALLGYFQPDNFGALIGAVAIAGTAINDIMLLFVEDKQK